MAEAEQDNAKQDRLFAEALRAYLAHHVNDSASGMRQPDREMSQITLGAEPMVALQNRDGVPLGTVVWCGESSPTYDLRRR